MGKTRRSGTGAKPDGRHEGRASRQTGGHGGGGRTQGDRRGGVTQRTAEGERALEGERSGRGLKRRLGPPKERLSSSAGRGGLTHPGEADGELAWRDYFARAARQEVSPERLARRAMRFRARQPAGPTGEGAAGPEGTGTASDLTGLPDGASVLMLCAGPHGTQEVREYEARLMGAHNGVAMYCLPAFGQLLRLPGQQPVRVGIQERHSGGGTARDSSTTGRRRACDVATPDADLRDLLRRRKAARTMRAEDERGTRGQAGDADGRGGGERERGAGDDGARGRSGGGGGGGGGGATAPAEAASAGSREEEGRTTVGGADASAEAGDDEEDVLLHARGEALEGVGGEGGQPGDGHARGAERGGWRASTAVGDGPVASPPASPPVSRAASPEPVGHEQGGGRRLDTARSADAGRPAARGDVVVGARAWDRDTGGVPLPDGAGGCTREAKGLGRSKACNAYDGPGSEWMDPAREEACRRVWRRLCRKEAATWREWLRDSDCAGVGMFFFTGQERFECGRSALANALGVRVGTEEEWQGEAERLASQAEQLLYAQTAGETAVLDIMEGMGNSDGWYDGQVVEQMAGRLGVRMAQLRQRAIGEQRDPAVVRMTGELGGVRSVVALRSAHYIAVKRVGEDWVLMNSLDVGRPEVLGTNRQTAAWLVDNVWGEGRAPGAPASVYVARGTPLETEPPEGARCWVRWKPTMRYRLLDNLRDEEVQEALRTLGVLHGGELMPPQRPPGDVLAQLGADQAGQRRTSSRLRGEQGLARSLPESAPVPLQEETAERRRTLLAVLTDLQRRVERVALEALDEDGGSEGMAVSEGGGHRGGLGERDGGASRRARGDRLRGERGTGGGGGDGRGSNGGGRGGHDGGGGVCDSGGGGGGRGGGSGAGRTVGGGGRTIGGANGEGGPRGGGGAGGRHGRGRRGPRGAGAMRSGEPGEGREAATAEGGGEQWRRGPGMRGGDDRHERGRVGRGGVG